MVRRRAAPSERSASDAVLAAVGLTAGYGTVATIHDINLELRPGQIVTLLGPNGAGKTTTLRTLCGGLVPLSGAVLMDGRPTRAPVHKRARQGIAYVPEERSIFRSLSCRDNLRLGDCDIKEALRIFPELEARLDAPAGLLSGGEQQMVALGRALSRRPRVIVADELSLGLAPLVVRKLLLALRAAASSGAAVLLVEQHVRQALAIADFAHVMRRGRIELSDSADSMLERIDEIERSYLSVPSIAAATNGDGGSLGST
jgi:branched-chain amino acid transport system ATP-binding protein